MLVQFLESKNDLLFKLFIVVSLGIVFLLAGIPRNPIDIFSFLLFLANFILGIYIIQEGEILEKPSYGIFLICLFSIVFYQSTHNLQIMASLLFVLGSYVFLTDMINQESQKITHSLEMGIFLSVAAFAYLPSALFMFVLPIYILFRSSDGLNGLVLFLMGVFLITAIGVQLTYLFELDYLTYFLNIIQINPLLWENRMAFLIPFLLICVLSFFYYLFDEKILYKKIRFHFSLLSIVSIAWLVILFFYAGNQYEWFFVLFLPASVFTSRYIQNLKSYFLKEFLLWILVLFVLIFHFESLIQNNILPTISDQISLVQEIFHQILQRYND